MSYRIIIYYIFGKLNARIWGTQNKIDAKYLNFVKNQPDFRRYLIRLLYFYIIYSLKIRFNDVFKWVGRE